MGIEKRGARSRDLSESSESSRTNERHPAGASSSFSYAYGYSFFDPRSGYVINYSGPIQGTGKSGIERCDDTIQKDLRLRLDENGRIDARAIDVVVREGRVTLRGTVEDDCSRRVALEIADSVPGVVQIKNELQIRKN